MKKFLILVPLLLCACTVGPDYKKPPVLTTPKFKGATKDWKIAEPKDAFDRGQWWKIFHDPQLTALEEQLNASNQTIAVAAANYQQAHAIVDEARAAYFPTLAGSVTLMRQKQGGSGGSFSSFSSSTPSTTTGGSTISSGSAVSGGGGRSSSNGPTTSHSWLLDASWEPDIWGATRRAVEAAEGGAQSLAALLASTRLSAQASLAQFYFELRGVDRDQQLLNDTVKEYRRDLQIVRNRYKSGVVARTDLLQAQTQLESAIASAINTGILRGQYEHAIAVLIGLPPAAFDLKSHRVKFYAPKIPVTVPSLLLERRPDIAQAERSMMQANAQIGVAISAYYPTLTLTGTAGESNPGFAKWFSIPAIGWALSSQLADTIYDGGLRSATVAAARAGYDSTVASYRQVVLTAFQDVEDNLTAVRLLTAQTNALNKAAADARRSVTLLTNQYKAGTVDYTAVIVAQNAAYAAEKTAIDTEYLRMTSTVGLVKSLGGGWDATEINDA